MSEALDMLLRRRITQQQQIAQVRPLPQATLRNLLDDFLIHFVHDTTTLKRSTPTLHKTPVVLEHGITTPADEARNSSRRGGSIPDRSRFYSRIPPCSSESPPGTRRHDRFYRTICSPSPVPTPGCFWRTSPYSARRHPFVCRWQRTCFSFFSEWSFVARRRSSRILSCHIPRGISHHIRTGTARATPNNCPLAHHDEKIQRLVLSRSYLA